MFGKKTTFTCAGEDILGISWIVGSTFVDQLDDALGQVHVEVEQLEDGCYRSNLTITGSAQNDKISVTCVLLESSGLFPLPPVHLTVLGG